jgi:hypothetical protein
MDSGGKKTCLECRIVGTCTLSSIALYAIHLHRIAPKTDRFHRLFLGGITIGTKC